MEHRKQAEQPQIERRITTGDVEIRKSESGKDMIRGYAFKFDVVYDMGWFTEEISRSVEKNMDRADVRVLQDHVSHLIMGRTKAGTARVGIDNIGGWYEADLPDSPNGHNLRVAVERGDIDQSSWGFMVRRTAETMGDRWEKRNGKDHRIIEDVSVWLDASAVTFPANPDTSVAKRSLETVQQAEQRTAQQQLQIEAEIGILDALFTAESIKNSLVK